MTRPSANSGMLRFLAHFLFVIAAWTMVIKYLFPMGYAMSRGEPAGTYVYLDFWPVVHVWLGWSLLHWNRFTYPLALVVSIAEIAIIVIKFVLFLSAPDWTIWRTNWFINKIFVLSCFVLLLGYLLARRSKLPMEGMGSARQPGWSYRPR